MCWKHASGCPLSTQSGQSVEKGDRLGGLPVWGKLDLALLRTADVTEGKSLQQEDVTYLFWLDYGRVKELPVAVAARLIAHGLVCETTALKGAQVIGQQTVFLTISQDGVYLLEMVRDGRNRRFHLPSA